MSKVNLKWRNRHSKEEGYVGKVSQKDGCFYAVFDKSGAKCYASSKLVNKDLVFLENIGEFERNEFFTEDV